MIHHFQRGSGSRYVANDAVTLIAAKLYLGWLYDAVTGCCAGFDHASYMTTIILIDAALNQESHRLTVPDYANRDFPYFHGEQSNRALRSREAEEPYLPR